MNVDLSGKRILLTGASRGIGHAVARQYLSSGARLAMHYNRNGQAAEELMKQFPGQGFTIAADLSSPTQAGRLLGQAVGKLGGLDVVVNNAGVLNRAAMDLPDEKYMQSWNETLQINLNAVALLSKQAVAHFRTQGGGVIINVSSRAAHRGDTSDYMAYAASKAGVAALTKTIARAYGQDNIAAFTIAPGFTRTAMAEEFIEKYGEGFVKDDIAWHTLTTPDDMAPMFALLASGMANHATGATFDINAGSYVR